MAAMDDKPKNPGNTDGVFDPDALDDAEQDENENEDDDEEGDGDLATLGLNVPEPPPDMKHVEGLAKAGPKGAKGLKGKARKAPGDKGEGAALGVSISDAAFGFEENTSPSEAETEETLTQTTPSAFDLDEITDPESGEEGLSPLSIAVAGDDKVWQNDELSAAERRILGREGYERAPIPGQEEGNTADGAKAKGKSGLSKAAGATAAVAVAGLAAGAISQIRPARAQPQAQTPQGPNQNAAQKQQARTHQNPATANPATQTTRPATQNQTQAQNQAQAGRPAPAAETRPPVLAPTPPETTSYKAPKNATDGSYEILEDMMIMDDGYGPDMDMGMNADSRFDYTMAMIYAAIGTDGSPDTGPYRQAEWENKRLEEKENSADIAGNTPEPPAPEPSPDFEQNREFSVKIGPGMG